MYLSLSGHVCDVFGVCDSNILDIIKTNKASATSNFGTFSKQSTYEYWEKACF